MCGWWNQLDAGFNVSLQFECRMQMSEIYCVRHITHNFPLYSFTFMH